MTRGICATNAALQEDGLDIHGQVIKQGHFLCLSIARVSKRFILCLRRSFLVAKFSKMLEEETITILTFSLICSMSKVLYQLPTITAVRRQECKVAEMIFDNFQNSSFSLKLLDATLGILCLLVNIECEKLNAFGHRESPADQES